MCSTLAVSSQGSCLSDIIQLAHTHSDGIVPDLHRVPYKSIAGTYSIGKNCPNMNLPKVYHRLSFPVNTIMKISVENTLKI